MGREEVWRVRGDFSVWEGECVEVGVEVGISGDGGDGEWILCVCTI